MVKYDIKKALKVAVDAIDETLDAIIYNRLSDGEKLEFFDAYKSNIIKMLKEHKKTVEKEIKKL